MHFDEVEANATLTSEISAVYVSYGGKSGLNLGARRRFAPADGHKSARPPGCCVSTTTGAGADKHLCLPAG